LPVMLCLQSSCRSAIFAGDRWESLRYSAEKISLYWSGWCIL
jgi:hypothetical protein